MYKYIVESVLKKVKEWYFNQLKNYSLELFPRVPALLKSQNVLNNFFFNTDSTKLI